MRPPISCERFVSTDGGLAARRIASIAMYRDPLAVTAATHRMWGFVQQRLRDQGIADVPEQLDDTIAHDAAWLDPRLLLAQSCGYPFATRLRGQVRLVAAPAYDHPGCVGASSTSFIIVPAESHVSRLDELRGRTVSVNDWHSNSGMNVLRGAIAPHAIGGRFFGRVIESGGHVASIALVSSGGADVAAIDCVTFGNLQRHAPERLDGVRVLAQTASTPTLPFVTRADAGDAELAALRDALAAFCVEPEVADACQTLGLRGFEVVPESAYEAVLAIERNAIAQGYPQIG